MLFQRKQSEQRATINQTPKSLKYWKLSTDRAKKKKKINVMQALEKKDI